MTPANGIWLAIGCAVGVYLIIAIAVYSACRDKGMRPLPSLIFCIFGQPVVYIVALVMFGEWLCPFLCRMRVGGLK